MDIAIFHEITTEDLLVELEAKSKKYYEGFYADMNNAPERKLVKESADEIKNIIKSLEVARIRITKENTASVNKEHKAIVDRLEIANEPFTLLLDEYKVERAKVLAAKKASDEAKAAALQLPIDHEDAINMNELHDFKIAQFKVEQEKRDEQLKAEAVAEAKQDLINAENKAQADAKQAIENAERAEAKRVADVEQARIDEQARQAATVKAEQDAENARLANKEHVRRVNIDALHSFMAECDFTYDQAKAAVTALAQNKILNTTINY